MKRIAVLMGGISAEREISLNSGKAVAAALASLGHQVTAVDVTAPEFDLPAGTDVVFIALHGTYGEDGQVQAYLTAKGVPFTGADEKSSRLAFDKILSKQCFEKYGVNTARFEILRHGQPRSLALPVVVKPPRQGSSIGLTIVNDESEWREAIDAALGFDGEILVESYIPGRELTVGVVGNEVLPIVEIRAPNGNYDYRAKYTKGVTEYLCPAPLDDESTRLCQQLAWKTFEALKVRGLGRVDIRLTDEGDPFVLELNTIPGFTETSLLPKAAKAAGYSFPELCDKIIRLTLDQNT
jgi:D-alanine-D-alanine ligase